MKQIESVMATLRSVHWSEAPQPATETMVEGAATYLHTYAIFVRDHHQETGHEVTPFASPIQILGVKDAAVPLEIAQECQRLTSQSPLAYDAVFAMRALEWAVLCDAAHPATLGRERIFEPLLNLVVHRVPAMIRKGYWVIDESMFPLPDWVGRYSKK